MNELDITHLKETRRSIAGRQQNKASDPKISVWVEASAGTGKTKVLTDRVLRLFLDGVHPAEILCLTYTKAAAVEMSGRIAKRLAGWAVADEERLYAELSDLLSEPCSAKIMNRARTLFALSLDVVGGIKIQTIHSFCQEILKRFPLEAGIPPYFDVMDERSASEILNNVSKELILKIDSDPDSQTAQAAAYLTRHIREFKFSELMQELVENRSKLLSVLSCYNGFEDFLKALRERLNISKLQTEEKEIEDFAKRIDRDQIFAISSALAQGPATDQKNADILDFIFKNANSEFDYESYKTIFLTKSGTIVATLAHKGAVKAMPDILDQMQELAQEVLVFEDYLSRLRLYQSTKAIMAIANELATGYAAYKRLNARLDYEDLISVTRRLLENPDVADWILYKLDSAINHVLIDEAQDTSPDQWAIIRALTTDFFAGEGQNGKIRTVFAVGDRKQSIYSFQGADPAEFDRMRRYFTQKSKEFATIRLDVSFRSTEAVLQTVNDLFAQENAKSGVVIDDEKVNHLAYRAGQAGKVEIWPLVEADQSQEDDVWYPPIERRTKVSASTMLARQIARNIKQMVENGDLLEAQNRPLQYGDFMVLVQRRNAFVEEFVRECKNLGVAITGVDKLRLREQIVVEDLLSLGQFLLLPSDDLSLAEVLKSPLCGLNDDDLFKLRWQTDLPLWQSLQKNQTYAEIVKFLKHLLSEVDYIRPYELFNEVLCLWHGREKFAARLGSEAEDAIDEFINLTLTFEQEHIPDLQSFIQWISADSAEVKRELEQADIDAVRLMTVHGSKGLQAPVVILPDTTRIVNIKRSAGLLWDEKNMVYYPLNSAAYDQNCEKVFEAEKQKAFDEYRRLLYVALTRAEDQLFICGSKSKKEVDDQSWYKLCAETMERFGVKRENGIICRESVQVIKAETAKEHTRLKSENELPSWAKENAAEEAPLAKPYMPSRPDEEDDQAALSPLLESGNYFQRGIIIHRILQLLTGRENREKVVRLIRSCLQSNAPQISDSQQKQIEREILKLWEDPELSFIFGEGSFAEVPVAGLADGRIVSARIDRLYVGADKVAIVDFKTNRPAAVVLEDIPAIYLKQLKIYKQLIEQIYPSKPVETYILWTNTANLMKVS